jgi:hypothetical protein
MTYRCFLECTNVMGVTYKSPARNKKVLYTRKEIYGAMDEDKAYNPGGRRLPEPLVGRRYPAIEPWQFCCDEKINCDQL